MMYEMKLPSMGEDSPEEAVVSYWLVDDGDDISEGEDLIEMTTDKAAFSLPSPVTGTLVEKLVEEGDEVLVGSVLCVIET
jgi:pyruvate/2-oxoglutarate dehydrogenase complex dihydrolipoamide acyltransferase (E2) component